MNFLKKIIASITKKKKKKEFEKKNTNAEPIIGGHKRKRDKEFTRILKWKDKKIKMIDIDLFSYQINKKLNSFRKIYI